MSNASVPPHLHAGPAVVPFNGGPVGIPEAEAKLGIDLDLRVGKVQSAVERLCAMLGNATQQPRYLSAQAQATADTSDNALIQLGPVPSGLRWVVHQLVVGGETYGSATGAFNASIGPAWPASADAAVPLINIQDFSATLPYRNFYGRGQFIVHSLNSIWIQITTGTSTDVYAASIDYVSETDGS